MVYFSIAGHICTNDTLLGRAEASPIVVTNTTNSRTCVCMYSATSIVRTSFIQNLNYPKKYITMHAQKVWSTTFCGCGYILSDELRALQALPWPKLIMIELFWTLLAMIMLYRCRYHKPGEKCRHFSYPDISLIRYGSNQPVDKGVWDNRGCTVHVCVHYCPITCSPAVRK